LAVVDPLYGTTKQDALNEAFYAGDVQRVANIFNAFIGAKPAQQQSMSQELSQQIAPSRTRSQVPPTQDSGKSIWTESQIKAFYEDKRKGLIPAEEAERYEQDLNAAVAEGRVRAG
jgi:predicted exporter